MKAIKIWNNEIKGIDTYLDFKGTFSCVKTGRVLLRLSCDSIFTFYINDEMVGFGSCSNFKKRKVYHTFDLTKYVKEKNELKITVWHQGRDFQTYINQDAFLMFEVTQGKETLLKSDKDILCRVNNSFKQGYQKILTYQLGFSFYFDNTAKELPFVKSTEYGLDKAVTNGIKNLKLLKRKNILFKKN